MTGTTQPEKPVKPPVQQSDEPPKEAEIK
ncbi:hypothetical protein KLER11_gp30 [Pararheinheimera phage vB_PsoM_KLER1-1]|nr:hypothetical protein KLER11_gp30 [Pararheinheimera phage vB_PsoM_KLER1-1]